MQKRICHIYLRDFIKEKSKNKPDKPKNSGAVYEDNGNLSVSSEMEYKSESVGIGLLHCQEVL